MTDLRLLAPLAALTLAAAAEANVRMVLLDENSQEITLRNFCPMEVDVSGYTLCRQPGTYRRLSVLQILGGGDLDLSPGEEVTLLYPYVEPNGGGFALYTTTGPYDNPNIMADYIQYKGVAGVREGTADQAGLWVPGTFAQGALGPYEYTGDGTQNGAAFWSTITPVGVSYCTASLNSAGNAELRGRGTPVASPLNLTLTARPVPDTTGLFFFGPNQLAGEPPFGEGVRCVGGSTQRIFPLVTPTANLAARRLSDSAAYAGSITSGLTLNFQYWFREPMSAGDLDGDGTVEPFNTSNALSVSFQ